MFCMSCGQELPDTAVFCMKCGVPLPAPTQPSASATSTGKAVLCEVRIRQRDQRTFIGDSTYVLQAVELLPQGPRVVQEVQFKTENCYTEFAVSSNECHAAIDKMAILLTADGWEPIGAGHEGLPRFKRVLPSNLDTAERGKDAIVKDPKRYDYTSVTVTLNIMARGNTPLKKDVRSLRDLKEMVQMPTQEEVRADARTAAATARMAADQIIDQAIAGHLTAGWEPEGAHGLMNLFDAGKVAYRLCASYGYRKFLFTTAEVALRRRREGKP